MEARVDTLDDLRTSIDLVNEYRRLVKPTSRITIVPKVYITSVDSLVRAGANRLIIC